VTAPIGPEDDLGPVSFVNSTETDLLRRVVERSLPAGTHVHFTNAFSVVSATTDARLRDAFAAGDCVVDGLPVIWGLRATYPERGWSRSCRVRGPDFFEAALDQGREVGLRHYFLGSSPETLELLRRRAVERFPGVEIVGAASPPYAPVDEVDWHHYLAQIRATEPDLVWVGLGTPKQDYVAELLARQDVRPYLAVGAAFDFTAGTVQRAPRWMQEVGLEWFYRLVAEPRRLWRRYLVGNTQFVVLVLRGMARRRRGAKS
jgi:N-acetylglucosaminyldiphosphoundecaprenol N-acetyl-beta-D-mannosaminyltransferase